jgi:hypothetical protein
MERIPKNKLVNGWLLLYSYPNGVIIFLFSYLGNWLDENHPSPKVYYNKILVMGVGLALYNVQAS